MVLITALFLSFGSVASTQKIDVFVETIAKQNIQKKLIFPGLVKSQRQSQIIAENTGVITRLKKQLGFSVSKNEIIAYIENPDPVYQFKPLPIRSSISGKVTEIFYFEGSQVPKGAILFTVTDPKSLVIEVQVPARDVSSLKIGSAGAFNAGESFKVKLIGLSPTPDASTLTSTALFAFESIPNSINSGIQGQVEYIASTRSIYIVPEEHVVKRDQKSFLRTVVDGKVNLVEVKLGERIEDQVEIQAGIKEGDIYVSKTAKHIKAGDEVTPIKN